MAEVVVTQDSLSGKMTPIKVDYFDNDQLGGGKWVPAILLGFSGKQIIIAFERSGNLTTTYAHHLRLRGGNLDQFS